MPILHVLQCKAQFALYMILVKSFREVVKSFKQNTQVFSKN